MIDTSNILAELQNAFFDIPFENSDFQNRHFVIAAQITPGRAFRAIGLKMFSKLRAIEELKFQRLRDAVTIDEHQATIDDPDSTIFAKRRAQIEIDAIKSQVPWTDKLLNDAIHELDVFYAEYKRLPAYTRELFEQEERQHFEQSLTNQLDSAQKAPAAMGAFESIKAMNHFENLMLPK